jgi:hypothetical protein
MTVKATSAPAEFGSPALISAARPGGEMRLPKNRGAWDYMVSPVSLSCRDGDIVPNLAKAWHTPGMNGNGRSTDNGGTGFKASLGQMGFVAVPHTFPVVAFGEKRDPGAGSTYLQRFESRGMVYHADAWHRPKVYGHITRWEFDAEGYHKFLCDVRDKVLGMKKPEDWQIEIATRALLEEIQLLQEREDARGRRLLAERLAQLPPDLIPPDLKQPAA